MHQRKRPGAQPARPRSGSVYKPLSASLLTSRVHCGKMASDLAVKEKVNREVLGALAKQKQSNSMAYMGNKPAVRSALAPPP